MATVTRQPFAPLDGARLQNLTSLKNRQNAFSPSSSAKRKASDSVEIDDFENLDPILYSKRSKGSDSFPTKDFFKPSSFVLTKASSTPSLTSDAQLSLATPAKAASSRPRTFLQPKSPTAKLAVSIPKSPVSAPAGRSPTRGAKRGGLLSSRRRTGGPFTRVDPPAFQLGAAAPFSLDAALKGTIPSYAARSAGPGLGPLKDGPELKSSWFFDIHEDTPEQEMTNLLQHGTCVLDISSDEESELKARRERAEGRDKENIPPADDVSQTSRRAARGDEMVIEKARDPLAQLNAAEYYAEGCDEASVVIVPGDEDEQQPAEQHQDADALDFVPLAEPKVVPGVEELMENRDEPAAKAAVLEPMEGTGESFELWESGSTKDEAEAATAPSPSPIVEDVPTEC